VAERSARDGWGGSTFCRHQVPDDHSVQALADLDQVHLDDTARDPLTTADWVNALTVAHRSAQDIATRREYAATWADETLPRVQRSTDAPTVVIAISQYLAATEAEGYSATFCPQGAG